MSVFAAFDFDHVRSHRSLLSAFGGQVMRVLLWPARVLAARQTLSQLAAMSEYELRDIGLSRQDLIDVTARPLDEDPTAHLMQSRAARLGTGRRFDEAA
jgi:uncharacterized protein YjiS (DUF1127 family)